jgi:cold shock CspA family protein
MPVKVYDIAKKLGLENKEILAKAKEMGIAAAKLPSSSLDKISAEWLEEEIIKTDPAVAARIATKPAHVEEPIVVIHGPTPAPEPPAEVKPKPQITITVSGIELCRLVDRIKNGEVEFRLSVAEPGYDEDLRVCLVRDADVKPAEAKLKADFPNRAEIDGRTKDLLRAAFYSSRHRAVDGWLNLADYGSAVKKLEATFQPQKFGERSLGSLLRRVGLFELRNDESNPIVYYLRMKDETKLPPNGPPNMPKAEMPSPAKIARGKIHNLRLGFGFIMPDDGSENAFFHATDIEGCTIYDLKPGDAVEYEPSFNEKGPCARKIHRLTN